MTLSYGRGYKAMSMLPLVRRMRLPDQSGQLHADLRCRRRLAGQRGGEEADHALPASLSANEGPDGVDDSSPPSARGHGFRETSVIIRG